MKLFARWRVKVWDRRLAKLRRAWQQAVERQGEHQHPEALDAVRVDRFFEQLVTQAMRRRTKWRKRSVGA